MNRTDSESDINSRIRNAVQEFKALRQFLLSSSEGETANHSSIDLEAAADLKNEVDALRLLLWAYLQSGSRNASRSPHELMSFYKMELALDMLRSARPQLLGRFSPSMSQHSDFERLIDLAMQASSRIPPAEDNLLTQ